MKLVIRHRTSYRYEAPADYAAQVLRVTPRPHAGLDVLSWKVTTKRPGRLARFEDGFGNVSHIHTVADAHEGAAVEVEGTVETRDTGGVLRGATEALPAGAWLRATELTAPSPAITELAGAAARSSTSTTAMLRRLMELVTEAIEYRKGTTDVTTTAAQALEGGSGVCQDHAHVFIAAARVLGIPARYVGGYLCLEGDGRLGPGAAEADEEEAGHAWAEALDGDRGWTGFDPANATLPGPWHVRTSVGLDYASASPVRGIRRGPGGEALHVGVQVARLAEQ